MTHKQALLEITGYLRTNWVETSIKWENAKFDITNMQEYIEPKLLPIPKSRVLMGSSKPFLSAYLLHINIFTRSGTGAARALELADLLEPLFLEKSINGIKTDVPTINNIGDSQQLISEKQSFHQVAFRVILEIYV